MLLLHYELPVGFNKPSAPSSTSKTINASEDFETEVYIEQSYNKQNKISKNSHTKNKLYHKK